MLNTNTDRDLSAIRQDLADIKELLAVLVEQQKPATTKTTKTTKRQSK